MASGFEDFSPSLQPRLNALGQPIGKPLPDFRPCAPLPERPLIGRYAVVEPFDSEAHALALAAAYASDPALWTYMPRERPEDGPTLAAFVADAARERGLQTFAILDAASRAPLGQASYMRHDFANGTVETGWVAYSLALRRSRIATEAMYLMMRHVFEHGYRRYEWKCDQLNRASNLAALRLGFQFEGVFRNAMVIKGRRRDTAWYSVIVEDWPAVRARLEAWLDPGNFDEDGAQRRALSDMPLG